MAEIRRNRTIAAEAQAIWDVLADFGAVSSWTDIVEHSCLLSPAAQAIGVGTARRVQLGRDALVERITEFDPPHALSYDVEECRPQLGRIRSRWTLSPTTGGTVVTLTTTVEIGQNPLQRLAENVVARLSTTQLDKLLTGLAARLEGSHV